MTREQAEVLAANRAFYRALEKRDLGEMELVWSHVPAATCVHPGWHRLDGWSEIRRSWENIFANSRPWTISCQDVRATIADETAWVTCVEVITPFGGEEPDDSTRMQATNVFVKGDGVWRMIHHHASPSPDTGIDEEEETVH